MRMTYGLGWFCALLCVLSCALFPATVARAQRFEPADQAFVPDTQLNVSETGIANDSAAKSNGVTDERTSQRLVSRRLGVVVVGDAFTFGGAITTRDFSEKTLAFDIAESGVENGAFVAFGFQVAGEHKLTLLLSKAYQADTFTIDQYQEHTQQDIAYAVGVFYRVSIFRLGYTQGHESLHLTITEPTPFASENYGFDFREYEAGLFLGDGSDFSASLVLRHSESPAVGGTTVSKKASSGDLQRLGIGYALDRDSSIGLSYFQSQSDVGFTSDIDRREARSGLGFTMDLNAHLAIQFGQTSTHVNVDTQAPVLTGGVVTGRIPRTYESLRVENSVRVIWKFSEAPKAPRPAPPPGAVAPPRAP